MITIKPQWDYLDIRREHGMIRSARLRYNVFGTTEAHFAEQALHQLAAPSILGNLYRVASGIDGRNARLAFEGWAEFEYQNIFEEEGEDAFTFSFDTTGGTQKLSQSYETLGRYAPPGMIPPNYFGAIGISDRNIEGCEVITPTLSFTMNRTKTGVLGISLIKELATFTGRINSQPFLHWNPGDILFEGASGSQKFARSEKPEFDVSLRFRVSPTIRDLSVGDIDVGYKRGWDYFWVHYLEMADEESNAMVQRPAAAYIERVYLEADLNFLIHDLFL